MTLTRAFPKGFWLSRTWRTFSKCRFGLFINGGIGVSALSRFELGDIYATTLRTLPRGSRIRRR